MNSGSRSRMVFGSLLLLAGVVLLSFQLFPGWAGAVQGRISWQVVLIFVGALLFLAGLLAGAAQLAVPAFVLAGIGGILYSQSLTGSWPSWSYAWTLLPGFAGLGQIARGMITGSQRAATRGIRSILLSGILFIIFASLFGGLKGMEQYWPVAIIVAGVLVLVQAFLGRR